MKALLLIAVLAGIGYWYLEQPLVETQSATNPAVVDLSADSSADSVFAQAFQNRLSDLQVSGTGTVVRTLSDDNEGSRHQRFILRLASGQTLLVAHNIDLAPPVSGIAEGDQVEFYGEYEWNDQGGVIHWTHKDPQGRHTAGWIRHRGTTYQ